MPRTIAPKSLIAKLAEACDAVGGVEKRGRNEFQKYNYVKAADVAKAIRHELFERGIVVVIDEKDWKQERMVKTNSGGEVPLMQLRAEITFRDERESLGPISAFATAFDSGDKAIYKAKTGLLKYALRGIGLIPDEKDDPEFDESVDEQTDPRVTEIGDKKGRSKRKGIAEYQARAWSAALRSSGKTPQQEADYLKVTYKVSTVMDLSPDQFKDAIKWAVGSEEDLTEAVAASVQVVKGKKQPMVEVLDQAPDEFNQEVAGD